MIRTIFGSLVLSVCFSGTASGYLSAPDTLNSSFNPIGTDTVSTDATIRQAIIDSISRDTITASYLPRLDIVVKEGVVTLSGMVDTFNQRNAIERAAKRTPYVYRVRNNIQVLNDVPQN